MTLLITVFAAIITTAVWYSKNLDNSMLLGVPCLMFWGASLMWFVDAAVKYAEIGAEYFTPVPYDMLNDSFLGLSVVALALIIWLIILFIKDPKGAVRKTLKNSK